MLNNEFVSRHNGPRDAEIALMLKKIGVSSFDELIDKTIPANIRLSDPLDLPDSITEYAFLKELKTIASRNKLFRTYIGQGYYNTITPSVIKRNILENPSWYTSYTPYQAEISQGRLEALLNFQTMIIDLTGLPIANASLLDEATAAAEAMIMMYNARSRKAIKNNANRFIADKDIFPQTLDVLKTRAEALKIELQITDIFSCSMNEDVFGILVQYPNSKGEICNYTDLTLKAHQAEIMVAAVADLLSLTLLTPPGTWGADVTIGSTQRFGIPMGYGGPHAAYFATKEAYKRNIPGRIIGVSVDTRGKTALRMSLQTREQHIKRERATSNICTAQALLASMAGMYAVYHGPDGLKNIALRIHSYTTALAKSLQSLGYEIETSCFFDTLTIKVPASINSLKIETLGLSKEINFCPIDESHLGISLDETTTIADLNDILMVFAKAIGKNIVPVSSVELRLSLPESNIRTTSFLKAKVFNVYHSETEMMRYIKKLERKDFSLTHSMISLGSCTMKLNAASEMFGMSWPEFGEIHPFVPADQVTGYHQIICELEHYLKVITDFDAVSFQPNSGAAGEYAGLMVIREFHKSQGQEHRNVVLIPSSAHGTNPASAAMAGMKIEVVGCDEKGNIRMDHLHELAEKHKDNLCAFMVTYPSTHGVFEKDITGMAALIHQFGGLVYMDGANMNAQVGLTNPASIGADICHLNLHKTFAIPHGGGGPGMGPIAVTRQLAPYLPSHPLVKTGGEHAVKAISAAPFGSASILTISFAYCKMLGGDGLTLATRYAILNANYLAACLKEKFDILFTGENGFVAHEMIVDCRMFKAKSDITETDISKRLMDYGFHAPTLSFPVHGTIMIEPTESESLQELDRFAEAMLSIYKEIENIIEGKDDKENNALKYAPHCQEALIDDSWAHPYSRTTAAFPLSWIKENKFWPGVSRIDDAYGDRNLVCTCLPLEKD